MEHTALCNRWSPRGTASDAGTANTSSPSARSLVACRPRKPPGNCATLACTCRTGPLDQEGTHSCLLVAEAGCKTVYGSQQGCGGRASPPAAAIQSMSSATPSLSASFCCFKAAATTEVLPPGLSCAVTPQSNKLNTSKCRLESGVNHISLKDVHRSCEAAEWKGKTPSQMYITRYPDGSVLSIIQHMVLLGAANGDSICTANAAWQVQEEAEEDAVGARLGFAVS